MFMEYDKDILRLMIFSMSVVLAIAFIIIHCTSCIVTSHKQRIIARSMEGNTSTMDEHGRIVPKVSKIFILPN